jgi:hypothetical protein
LRWVHGPNKLVNFIIYNISLHYDTQIIEKINQITFYFAEGEPGRGSEGIKKER